MALETRVSNQTYERLALAEPDRKRELVDGHLREKPGMTAGHNRLENRLGYLLMSQLDWAEFEVRIDSARVSRPGATYFIPDVCVVPAAQVTQLLDRQDIIEMYSDPLPLIVEVWSRSTSDYDVSEKLKAYKERGDSEIWLVHPYERTLTTWVRQPDGGYKESTYREGACRASAMPHVAIDLAELFPF